MTGTLPTTATYTTAVSPTHAPLKQKKILSITLSIAFAVLLSCAIFITAIIIFLFRKKFRQSNKVTIHQTTYNGNVADFEDHNTHELQEITCIGDNGNAVESNDHNSTQELNHTCNESGVVDEIDDADAEITKTLSPVKSLVRQISRLSRQLSTKSGYSELSNPSTPPSFRHSTSRQSSNSSSNGN